MSGRPPSLDQAPTSTSSARRPRFRRAIKEHPTREQPRRAPARVLHALLVEMRPKQWIKNLSCFAGLIFSGRLFLLHAQEQALLGFGSFCLASSSVYILNDFFDRDKDRHNPRTASRPIASGALPLSVAAVAFFALVLAAGFMSAALGPACLGLVGCYFAMNVLYTTRLKRIVIADVMCIALGFVMRVLHGVYSVGARPTPWILLCMFFLALFLGFAKRKGELASGRSRTGDARPVLEKYNAAFLDTLVTMTATMTILCYAMFTVASRKNPTLVITIIPVVYCVCRFMLQVMTHDRGESPDEILITDKRLWAGISCWLASYIFIIYSNIHIFSEHADWYTG